MASASRSSGGGSDIGDRGCRCCGNQGGGYYRDYMIFLGGDHRFTDLHIYISTIYREHTAYRIPLRNTASCGNGCGCYKY